MLYLISIFLKCSKRLSQKMPVQGPSGVRNQAGGSSSRTGFHLGVFFILTWKKLLCCAQHMLIIPFFTCNIYDGFQNFWHTHESLHLSISQHRLTTITGQWSVLRILFTQICFIYPQDQNGHQDESIGPEEEGPIPQWAPSPPGPPPSCLRSRPGSSTELAPPLPPQNPAKSLRG